MRKQKTFNWFIFSIASLAIFFLVSCDDEGGAESELNFDQGAMLTNIGQKVIFPNYANFNTLAANLQQTISDFTENPTEETLEEAQETFKETYLAWQRVNIYNFGPAEEVALRQNLNEFPTQTNTIESKIASGSWDLNSFTSVNQKGFPALDYLLFSGNTNTEILAQYTSAENAENRRQYLLEVTDDVYNLAHEVFSGWDPEQGNYLGEFNTTLGNSAGSSLSLLVNNLNEGYEMIKNKKLNIPLGNRSIDGEPIPRAVEAYYSGISLDLLKTNLESVENTFRGRSNGTEGPGLDDYLDAHYQAGNIQNDLTDQILNQFSKAKEAVNAIPDPLSEAVVIAPDKGNAAYNELQNLVVYLKNDMPQALSVLISYVDNDGD